MRRVIGVCAALLAYGGGGAPQAATRGLTVQDLIALERLSEPATSPAHARVAFTVSTLDAAANRRRTDVWVVDADGAGPPVRLTRDPASDTSPAWSPDGSTIYFLSSRSGSSQVWRAAASGSAAGEAQQVTTLPLDVGAFRLSPDGRQIAVALEVYVECPTLACTAARLEAQSKQPATGRLYDRLFFRHWDSWKDGRRSHVFVVPAGGGDAVDVMKGMDADSPTKPFGGSEEFSFTPDGRSVVFTARDAGRDEAWSTDLDLFVAPADGSAKPRNLTNANAATDTGPVFSPDGRTLAYRAMARAGYESDRLAIVVQPWPEGSRRILTEAWDRSANEIVWSADSRTIYTTAGNVGQQSLFAVDAGDGRVRTVVNDGHLVAPSLLRPAGQGRGRLAVLIDHLRSPAELFTVDEAGAAAPVQRTAFNKARLADLAFGEPEQFSFAGWNNETVHAWVVKPTGFDAGRKYPIAFLIHGGPQGSFANNFHYRWNPQTYAGAGYAAIMVDFHGSTGYGQAFTDAIRGDWGGKPLVDLQKGLDAALAKYPWLDGARACALGASYGGYMINWIAGNWPDRFRCLVNHDGNLDERFAYYATEELWFPEWEHGGTPDTNPAGYAKHNPIDHLARWKTPMLVIHGARDFRVVESQGMATFTSLQRKGIPSRFLYFPDENHWVLKPANSVLWHETVLGWLDRWLK
jgi:dipeptidyl aminopeptidase/acylaminoacyl peptidase